MKEIIDINKKVVEVKYFANGIAGLPKANLLKYFLEDESWVTIRPSGTEPKFKFYIAEKRINEVVYYEKVSGIKVSINDVLNKLI